MLGRENRDVAMLCTVKAWGGLMWGFADLVATRQVRQHHLVLVLFFFP